MTTKTAEGLTGKTSGSDALRWIHTAKVVLNRTQVDVPIPSEARYVLLESIKPHPDGHRYNVVFYTSSSGDFSYERFGSNGGIIPGKIYELPHDTKKIHLGLSK